MTTTIIFGPRAVELRKPATEQKLVGFVLNVGSTDMMCCDAIQGLVQSWSDAGGDIATACGRVLDIERAEYTGEEVIYDTDGQVVFLEPRVPLIRIEDCFGASPRRCINHMRAKAGQISQRRVSVENLSRYYWVAVAKQAFKLTFD
ncbi:hypothetical protein [Sulfitobacter pacificus]|uniref:hypothetical protein n=1 Tax=Sulfitobacter pacificus TaxID=1499314 RepID=UPI00310AF94C